MATSKLVGQVTCYWEVNTTVDAICEDCEEGICGEVHQLVYYHYTPPEKKERIVHLEYCPSCYNDLGEDEIEIEFEPWQWGDDVNLN